MSRRLLTTSSAGGSVASDSFDIHWPGYWNQQSEPRAVYYNGKTYIAWVTQADTIEIAAWDHASQRLGQSFVLSSGLSVADVHNSVAVCVRDSDKRIVVAYCAQDDSSMKVRISTNPEDVSSFGAPISIAANVGTDFTYVLMYQLVGATSQPIYIFSQTGQVGYVSYDYSVSWDGGATWSSFSQLVIPEAGKSGLYVRLGPNRSGTKFHLFATNTVSTPADPANLYHLIFNGAILTNSSGAPLGSVSIPATSGTLIQNSAGGTTRALGWSEDDSGRPACIMSVYDTTNSTLRIKVARWTGTAWQVNEVTDSNGLVLGSSRMSEAAIDKEDPDVCYVSKRVGPTYWEMWRYTTPDSGLTWSGSALTSGSANHHVNPDTPLNANGLRALWGYGEGTSLDFHIKATPI